MPPGSTEPADGRALPTGRSSRLALALKVLAIAICAALLGLSLPAFDTLDYWIGMAAFVVALLVVVTL